MATDTTSTNSTTLPEAVITTYNVVIPSGAMNVPASLITEILQPLHDAVDSSTGKTP